MASGQCNNAPLSSDKEEEIFASFSVEDVAELRQRRLEQDLLEDVDREIEEFMDLGAHERGTDSDVELFGSEDKGKEEEESDDSADETEDVPFRWSNVLGEIDIEEFSASHGATKDLGDRATSKDFLNLFMDDDYLDEIVRCTIAYARSKGDETFATSRAEISAYLGLNIYMGIHSLPQIDMFWDSDIFIGVEGFKKTIPKQRFKTLGRYLHLVRSNLPIGVN